MNSKFIKITLATAVLVFVSVGYLFLSGKTEQKEESKEKVANNTVSTTKTVDWKTYKNEKYGFEVKYPSDYETADQLNDGGQLSIKPIGENEVPFIDIGFIHNQDKNLLENDSLQRLSDVNKYRKIIDEKISISGLNGRIIGNSGEKDMEENLYREIFVDLKEKILFIKSVDFDEKTLNQILSTFKFTK